MTFKFFGTKDKLKINSPPYNNYKKIMKNVERAKLSSYTLEELNW